MKAFFAAVIGKSGYEKWKVNEPGVFHFLFYVQSREIPKKPVAGIARKESRYCFPSTFGSKFTADLATADLFISIIIKSLGNLVPTCFLPTSLIFGHT